MATATDIRFRTLLVDLITLDSKSGQPLDKTTFALRSPAKDISGTLNGPNNNTFTFTLRIRQNRWRFAPDIETIAGEGLQNVPIVADNKFLGHTSETIQKYCILSTGKIVLTNKRPLRGKK